jgi:hypothetical protein
MQLQLLALYCVTREVCGFLWSLFFIRHLYLGVVYCKDVAKNGHVAKKRLDRCGTIATLTPKPNYVTLAICEPYFL